MKHLAHLVARFFRSVCARRPGVEAQGMVAELLAGDLAEVFWRQPVPDLDHAVRGARHILEAAPNRPELVRAFLLHDVGKRHARLGTVGRSVVTALSLLRLPAGDRGRAYLDHAVVGANELAALGAEPLTVAFSLHHHGSAPEGVADGDWAILVAADRR